MLVHGMRPGQQLLEIVEADGQRQRQADHRPQRVAAANPVPEGEGIGRIDAEAGDFGKVGGHGDEVSRHGGLAQRRHQPGARRGGVLHGLLGGEGLAGDDEQRGARLQAGQHRGEVGGVEVGDVMGADLGVAVSGQRLGRHARAEVGAADADVHDVGDRLAGGAAPVAAVDLGAEAAHLFQLGVHGGHHVIAGMDDRPLAGRMAQRDVQRGSAFGVVDRLAAAHARYPARQICRLPQRAQQRHGIGINALLGVVQQPIVPCHRMAGEAISIGGEHVAQMTPPQAFGSGA
jgi:hypothetical protein